MREDEWLAWGDPREMLEFLRGAVDDRKLRLLGIGWVQTLPEYIDACYGVKTWDYGLYLQMRYTFPFQGPCCPTRGASNQASRGAARPRGGQRSSSAAISSEATLGMSGHLVGDHWSSHEPDLHDSALPVARRLGVR